MKNKKKLNNKGFSLVELIIVVAIMAVLVGVLAPQYMRYIDRSKVGIDEQLADNIRTAITTEIMDPQYTDGPGTSKAKTELSDAGSNTFWKDFYTTMGVTDAKYETLQKKLSLDTTGKIYFTIVDGAVEVEISGGKYADAYKINVK